MNADKQSEIPAQIRGYLESLIKDSGMEMLEEEMHEEMVKELYVRLDSYITAVIVEHMPADHLEGFIKLHEDNKPQSDIEHYMKEHVPNVSEVMTQAFMDFRDEYLGASTLARHAPRSSDRSEQQ